MQIIVDAREKTSRPKARDGHRYPCPAEWFVYGSLLGKQGFGPEGGQSPVEHWGNLSIRLSVLLGAGVGLSWASQSLLGAGSNAVAISGLS